MDFRSAAVGEKRPVLLYTALDHQASADLAVRASCLCSRDLYQKSLRVRAGGDCVDKVAESTNIAQCAIHLFNAGKCSTIVLDSIGSGKKSKKYDGMFFLSGNKSTQFGRRPMQILDEGFSSTCEIPTENPLFLLRQRTQPNPVLMCSRFALLGLIDEEYINGGVLFADNLSEELHVARSLGRLAKERVARLSSVEEKAREISQQIVLSRDVLIETEMPPEIAYLLNPTLDISKKILMSIANCLDRRDFAFITLPRDHAAIAQTIILPIQRKLYGLDDDPRSQVTTDHLYNSADFNFGCSEQLLMDELISSQTKIALLIGQLGEIAPSTDMVVFQIDTTKSPCKVCILDILMKTIHPDGSIKRFFDNFPSTARKVVVITYSEPYKCNYDFCIKDASIYEEFLTQSEIDYRKYPVNLVIVPNISHLETRMQLLKQQMDETAGKLQQMVGEK